MKNLGFSSPGLKTNCVKTVGGRWGRHAISLSCLHAGANCRRHSFATAPPTQSHSIELMAVVRVHS